MTEAPTMPLMRDTGKPEWEQIVDLFKRHGAADLPWMLRDELVGILVWARYGEARASSASPVDAVGVEQWRSMDSAPKDGTDILLRAINQTYQGKPVEDRVTVGHWSSEEECRVDIGDCGGDCHCREYEFVDPTWISWDGGFTTENAPDGWMPLPPVRPRAALTVGTGEASHWAVSSKSGTHVGLWTNKAIAEDILREYPGGTITPLYSPTPVEPSTQMPVAWQCRRHNDGKWSSWVSIAEDSAISEASRNRTDIQVRPLYASPQYGDRGSVKIKPLVWRDRGDGTAYALSDTGLFYVASEKAWGFRYRPDQFPVDGGIEAAISAAQAYYEQLILSALSPQPAPAAEGVEG